MFGCSLEVKRDMIPTFLIPINYLKKSFLGNIFGIL